LPSQSFTVPSLVSTADANPDAGRAGYANATTNRIFQCLRRAYNLAGLTPPKFELLHDDELGDFVRFCWTPGMRMGEAAALLWSYVPDGQFVIPPEVCKAREPHVLPIVGPIKEILARRQAARSFEAKSATQLSSYFSAERRAAVRGIPEWQAKST
jgi:integrase